MNDFLTIPDLTVISMTYKPGSNLDSSFDWKVNCPVVSSKNPNEAPSLTSQRSSLGPDKILHSKDNGQSEELTSIASGVNSNCGSAPVYLY